MFIFKHLSKNQQLSLSIIVLLTIYQLIRVIAFANVHGGVEHDSGWFLSVSRSLAEQGTFTTMVSTVVDPHVVGDINIDQKFDIQAADGRIWFFTGNGNGPVSIVANAIVLKIFGSSFWALRAGPLLFYLLFLSLAAYILYRLAGLGAVILLHGYLFFYPHLSIFLSYEAMGEIYSIVFILWTYLAFDSALQKQQHRLRYFFWAGLIAGLTINTKLITLMSISGIFVWAGMLWLVGLIGHDRQQTKIDEGARRSTIKLRFRELLLLSTGIPLTLALWELVHLIVLTRLAGFELYQRQLQQRITFILNDGSGVGLQIYSGAEFFWDKFFLLDEVAHPQRWVTALIFAIAFLGGAALLWVWRTQPDKQSLLASIWLGWIIHTAWFVGIAKTGWPRHFWFALLLAVMLLCVVSITLLQTARAPQIWSESPKSTNQNLKYASLLAAITVLTMIGWGFVSQRHVWSFFLPNEIVPYWQEKQVTAKYDASLPWIIIPRTAQAEVVDYIKQLPAEANVYYPGQHKSAEISVQSGRIQYPLARRALGTPHPADVALIGPSLTSPWSDPVRRRDLLDLVRRECPQPAIENSFYMICPIEANLVTQ